MTFDEMREDVVGFDRWKQTLRCTGHPYLPAPWYRQKRKEHQSFQLNDEISTYINGYPKYSVNSQVFTKINICKDGK